MKNKNIFGLDIGTRSVVGTVGHKDEEGKYIVDAISVKEHDTRAMLDGQIHDVEKVVEAIKIVKKELEKKISGNLHDVCIAAAGRVLKTVTVKATKLLDDECVITEDHVNSLELSAVEKAYEELKVKLGESNANFYCVGYSAINYTLNDYQIIKLQGHRGSSIGVELLATFLPTEVIEDLYTAVEAADLEVVNLTLEPIAALNVAIPEKFRLLNIALVDIGAGTSDICITKDGSVVAYGMIPCAGDEISEYIAKKYLIEFGEAERIKIEANKKNKVLFEDILGIKHTVLSQEIYDAAKEGYKQITKQIADKIVELNAGKPVSAVFVVGGGGKIKGFVDTLAQDIGIQKERVALRGEEVLKGVEFVEDVHKDSLLVTPIGISLDYYQHKSNFVNVKVNDQNLKLYNTSKLALTDVIAQLYMGMDKIFAKRGETITYYVNGKKRVSKGECGESAIMTINGKQATLSSYIKNNDIIHIKESTKGKDGSKKVYELDEYNPNIRFNVDGNELEFLRLIKANDKIVDSNYNICDGDVIEIPDYLYVSNIIDYMDLNENVVLNLAGRVLTEEMKVPENSILTTMELRTNTYDAIEVEDGLELFEDKDKAIISLYQNDNRNINRQQIDSRKVKEDIENFPSKKRVISVDINGTPVKLLAKEKHIFVDILDAYPFDTSKYRGNGLVMNVNSQKADFSTPIKNNDKIEIYWAE